MSTVILDTITGKSTATTITIGSTPVVSASANSMTIRGEGSAQTSIQQGLAKTWINMKGEDTFANNDSFNVSGVTDNGTGNHTVTIATNMANATYSALINASEEVDGTSNIGGIYLARTFAAGSYVNITMDNDGSLSDRKLITNSVHGDLA